MIKKNKKIYKMKELFGAKVVVKFDNESDWSWFVDKTKSIFGDNAVKDYEEWRHNTYYNGYKNLTISLFHNFTMYENYEEAWESGGYTLIRINNIEEWITEKVLNVMIENIDNIMAKNTGIGIKEAKTCVTTTHPYFSHSYNWWVKEWASDKEQKNNKEENMNLFKRLGIADVYINEKKGSVTVELINGSKATSHQDKNDIFDVQIGVTNAYIVALSGTSKTQFKKELKEELQRLEDEKQLQIDTKLLNEREKIINKKIRDLELQKRQARKMLGL